MILLIKLMFTLAVPILLGYCVIALISKTKLRISCLERFSLSWGAGIGLLGLGMFTMSLLGISLNLPTILIPSLIVIIILAFYLLANRIPIFDMAAILKFFISIVRIKNIKSRWQAIAEIILILLIALTIAHVFFDALVKPLLNFDDLWRQGCIAKIIFSTGKVFTEQSVELAGPHPYLNPLSQAWIYMGLGVWNDALGKIIFPLCFASLVFIFYGGVRRYTGRFHALLFTYLLTALPLIVYHAGTAYSDLMQTFYYSAGIIYLFHWMNSRNDPDLYFSAILLGIGNFVKQTGIPLWLIATVVLIIFLLIEDKRKLKQSGSFILISTIISSPWLLGPKSSLVSYLRLYSGKLLSLVTTSANTASTIQPSEPLAYPPPTIMDILIQLSKRMFTYADWQLLWFVLIAVIVVKWQKIIVSKLKYLLISIILFFAMMVYIFSSYGIYRFLLDGTLVHRAMMWQAPVALYLIAIALLYDDRF
ncbi:MAG: glycosyltransferase family 39 protein [Candidatus Margulisbacteria bacterium]|nr:glycosyltransferase family 39 protein [Candidatus Margulisiibacteriota bacterium]